MRRRRAANHHYTTSSSISFHISPWIIRMMLSSIALVTILGGGSMASTAAAVDQVSWMGPLTIISWVGLLCRKMWDSYVSILLPHTHIHLIIINAYDSLPFAHLFLSLLPLSIAASSYHSASFSGSKKVSICCCRWLHRCHLSPLQGNEKDHWLCWSTYAHPSISPLHSHDTQDESIAVLFTNCFPNTLDTTIGQHNQTDTFVITGDIDAMWLR